MRRGNGWYLIGAGDDGSEDDEEGSWEEGGGVGEVESGEAVGIGGGTDGSWDKVADRGEGDAPRFEVSTTTSDEGEMVEEEEEEEVETPSKELLPPPA